ncbi:MAG: T9SS type A sorting domain-containing protein [Bacteroidia bacterium]|nr:T9SS type A sorting domain-containing protein [Bacteroidia bacterium]
MKFKTTFQLIAIALLAVNTTTQAQYCTNNLGGDCSMAYILDMRINGTTLSNMNSGCAGTIAIPAYTHFATSGNTTATLSQGSMYTIAGRFDSLTAQAAVWIDFDNSGTFDYNEYTEWTAPTQYTSNITILVPNNAYVGQIGMRVRSRTASRGGNFSNTDACSTFGNGETEDYTITIAAGIPCVGMPTTGILSAARLVTCAHTIDTLTLTGASQGFGIKYEWQSSTDSTTWTNTGDTLAKSYNYGVNLGDSIYYRVKINCLSTGMFVYSNNIKIKSPNTTFECYCKDNLGTDCFGPTITNVTIAGTTLNNTTTCTTGYDFNYPTTPSTTASVLQAVTYNINIITQNANTGAIWLDTDKSGGFDSDEYIPLQFVGNTGTATILIPSTAALGLTGLRVRVADAANVTFIPSDGCSSFAFIGAVMEIEDYIITIAAGIPCSGTPNAGTLTASNLMPCANYNDTLNLTGATQALGISYTWQTSHNNSTWATTTDSTLQAIQTGLTLGDSIYYRVGVACNAAAPVYSNTLKLTTNPDFAHCYCMSNSDFRYDTDDVGAFTFGTFNNIESTTPPDYNTLAVNQYSNHTSLGPIQAQQAVSFPLSITQINTFDFYTCLATVYIDYDHSGVYDANEVVFTGTTSVNNGTINNMLNGSVFIPAYAKTGLTGLRIVLDENTSTSMACGTYTSGETEDYIINIAPGTPCTGAPIAGTINITDTMLCVGNTVKLTLQGNTQGLNIATLWESSTNGTTGFTPTGDTTLSIIVTSPLDSMYYRVKVTCNNATPVYTANTTIKGSPAYACYCSSNLGQLCGAPINNVTISGTSLNNTTGCNSGYEDFYPTTSTTTTNLQQAVVYTLNVATTKGLEIAAWIDFDQSGTFDGWEYNNLTVSAANGTVSIYVPANATLGYTGMRIRAVAFKPSGINGSSACANLHGSETEDYVLNITAGTPCAGTPTAGTLTATATTLCSNEHSTLTLTGQTLAVNISTVWQTSIDGINGWNNTGDSSFTISDYAPADSIFYRVAVNCSGGAPLYTNVIKLSAAPAYLCYCSNLGGGCGNGHIQNIELINTTLSNTNSGCTTTAYTKYLDAGSTTATVAHGTQYFMQGSFEANVIDAGFWIDYDHSGTFDGNELMQWGTPANAPTAVAFIIPPTAILGKTGLRVRSRGYNFGTTFNPCFNEPSGETEDYTITIVDSLTVTAISHNPAIVSVATYPNPTNDVVTIHLTGVTNQEVTCQVFNSLGQMIYTYTSPQLYGNQNLKVSLANYATGTYTVRTVANNNVSMNKIVLQR